MASPSKTLLQILEQNVNHLREVSEEKANQIPDSGKWSRKEILGHLIDSAGNNHQRFVRAQLCSELHFPEYAQTGWIKSQNYAQEDWFSLVELWYYFNKHLAYIIEHFPSEKLKMECHIGESDVLTIEKLIQEYIDHLVHHLKQLSSK